jgi:hypothetical protein
MEYYVPLENTGTISPKGIFTSSCGKYLYEYISPTMIKVIANKTYSVQEGK